MEIFARDYGVLPNAHCTKELDALLGKLSEIKGDKKLIFDKGTYYLDRKDCRYIYRAITNTSAAKEYKGKGEVFMHYVPFILEDIKDLTVDGQGSVFLIDGKVTNMVISRCENIRIENLTLRPIKPFMHKLTVRKASRFSATFALQRDSAYAKDKDGFYWYGDGYRLNFTDHSMNSYWISSILPDDKNTVFRTAHPFRGAIGIRETEPYTFRVRYLLPASFTVGQTYYVFDVHRSDVGIFLEESKNITLNAVEQNFSYSLAYVAQVCENLTVENCVFAPEAGSDLELISIADFMQVCMCGGQVTVRNNYFDGASDDALNVHGIHFSVSHVSGNTLQAAFRHPQTWGFNPLRAGDRIEFINPLNLLCVDENRIVSSEMLDDHHIALTLEKAIPSAYSKLVLEDTDLCPSLLYENNTLNRIITRGILYTSRGKCVIRNNHFRSNYMSGILLSDDARSWFESGMCKDVTIENNVFDNCGEAGVLIKPENLTHAGAVHSNIVISGNTFKKYKGACIQIKSADNVRMENNTFGDGTPLETKNCTNIQKDF